MFVFSPTPRALLLAGGEGEGEGERLWEMQVSNGQTLILPQAPLELGSAMNCD